MITLTSTDIGAVLRTAADRLALQPTHQVGGSMGEPMSDGTIPMCAGAMIARVMWDMGFFNKDNVREWRLSSFKEGGAAYGAYRFDSNVGVEVEKSLKKLFGSYTVADFNDSHSKEETVDMLRKVADDIAPEQTVSDMLPDSTLAPNLWAGFGDVNTSNEATPDDYRRRLLAWAELLESDVVNGHWNYSVFAHGNMRAIKRTSPASMLSCGTTGCAAGWLHVVPEAEKAGFLPNFYRTIDNGWERGCDDSDRDSKAAMWLGLTHEELHAIYMATPVDGMPPLDMSKSSPSDVAKAIRWLADTKYPVPTLVEPAKPTAAKPACRRSREPKPGTKRFWAKLFRGGAKQIERRGRRVGGLFGIDGSVCAIGGIYATLPNADELIRAYNNSTMVGGLKLNQALAVAMVHSKDWTYWRRPTKDVEVAVIKRLFGKNMTIVDFNDDSDSEGRTKEVLRAMRAIARELEHGGKLDTERTK